MTNEDKWKLETAIRAVIYIYMLKDNKYNNAEYTAEQILSECDRLRENVWFTYKEEI